MERTVWNDLSNHYRSAVQGLRVGVYGSGGSPYHHAALAALWGADVRPVHGEEIRAGGLKDVEVLVVPGGGAQAMAGLLSPMGDDGADAVRSFVEGGGMYIGSCAGSFLPVRVGDSFWEENPSAKRMCMVDACLVNSGDSEWAGLTSPGVGTIVAGPSRPRHWLARGLPPRFHLVHYNGPMFDVAWTGDDPALGRAEGVVRFLEATDDFTPGEAFMSDAEAVDRTAPESEGGAFVTAPGGTLFDHGVATGAHTALAAEVGTGIVVLYGSHPEFGLDEVQLGWSDGVRLFGNALAEQARRRPVERAGTGTEHGGVSAVTVIEELESAADRFSKLVHTFSTLAEVPFEQVARGGALPAFLGRAPEEVWHDGCRAASRAADASARQLRAWLQRGVSDSERSAALSTWLRHEPTLEQDYGFAGLAPLLDVIENMLQRADTALAEGTAPAPLAHAYDGLDRHPYQLTASSYLSAAGLTASATLAVAAVGTMLEGAQHDLLMDVLLA
jgi:putative intracellular protease/amidase